MTQPVPKARQAGRQGATKEALYRYVVNYIDLHQEAPTFAEMCAGIDVISKSVITRHLQTLVNEGRLTYLPGVARSIKLLGLERRK